MKGFDPTDDDPDHGLTFDEWSGRGFWIKKGSKAVGFSPDGKALFTPSQVKPPNPTYRQSGYRTSQRTSFGSTPYYREHEVPPGAYDSNRLPSAPAMDYFMSMMNPNHSEMRRLENHLDSVFEKHHGGAMDMDDDY